MASLPQDPWMLLSAVNMKLRDRYASLEALCDDLDVPADAIMAALEKIGYSYDPEKNAFLA